MITCAEWSYLHMRTSIDDIPLPMCCAAQADDELCSYRASAVSAEWSCLNTHTPIDGSHRLRRMGFGVTADDELCTY